MKTLPSLTKITTLFIISAFVFNTSVAQNVSTVPPTLYGTTMGGGKYSNGSVFSYNLATGQESVLIDFDTANGNYPLGNLTEDKTSGLLYGTTMLGGKDNDGVMFAYNPSTGSDSILDVFTDNNGKWPGQGGLTDYNKMYIWYDKRGWKSRGRYII